MGHPDGQTVVTWRGPILNANAAALLGVANPISVRGYVTNFASLDILISPNPALDSNLAVNFYTDDTLAIPNGSRNWQAAPGQQHHVIMPILGNYVVVTITSTHVGALSAAFSITPTNVPVQAARYFPPVNGGLRGRFNVALSTTRTIILPVVIAGPAYWYVQDLNLTGKLQAAIYVLDAAGAFVSRLDQVNTVTGAYSNHLILPPEPVALVLINSDAAAAHICDAAFMIDER